MDEGDEGDEGEPGTVLTGLLMEIKALKWTNLSLAG